MQLQFLMVLKELDSVHVAILVFKLASPMRQVPRSPGNIHHRCTWADIKQLPCRPGVHDLGDESCSLGNDVENRPSL
jgi:hypothetical protein